MFTGLGIVTQILLMLDEVSFGEHYFEIGLMLRESMLINGLLFNSEIWYGLTKNDILELEGIDKLLLRKLLKAHSKTPIESLYLELGILPIKYIIKNRRIMYLHYILTRDNTELISKFFKAQYERPVKNDWSETIINDLLELGINLSFEEIKELKKEEFAVLVKKEVRNLAFSDLMKDKEKHSKLDNIEYKEFKIQDYFVDDRIESWIAKEIFKFRTRMTQVNENFKNNFQYESICPICKDPNENDDQNHLLNCKKLNDLCPIKRNYFDIFSNDIIKIYETIRILMRAMETRKKLLEQE